MQQQTIGRYQVLEEIVSGGQGTVYRAWDTANGTVVALKVLHPHLASDLGVLERFRREAQLAAAVVHPNITTIYEIGEDGNRHFIAMEYLPDSIHNVIQSVGKLPIERAVDICYQAAMALEAASRRGIIHRDIKPQNLLLAPDSTVKVTDFGIARATAMTTMTQTGALMVATATPVLPTPRPTPAPTENPDQRITVGTAATEAPPFLRSQIGSEVSAQDREIAAATIECVFEYLDSLGLPEISDHITLHMYEDFETAVETYSIQAGQCNSFSRDFWKERFADSWPDWAFINLSNPAVDRLIQDVPLLTFHIANTFTRAIL